MNLLMIILLALHINALNSLPCLLFLVCMRDTFVSETAKLQDPRRLYAPGRMYHIVERKFCRYCYVYECTVYRMVM